jgi:hypothetical protein
MTTEDLRPRVKRTAKQRVFRTGELTRITLSVLRKAERPMTVREIAAEVAAKCRLDMSTIPVANVAVANVRAVLARPHEGLWAEKRGREPTVYRVMAWQIGLDGKWALSRPATDEGRGDAARRAASVTDAASAAHYPTRTSFLMAHQLSRMKPTTLRKTAAEPMPIKSPANGDSS